MNDAERELARARWRRFDNAELSPAELAVEIERWVHHRALLTGDLKARDFSECHEDALTNSIVYADLRLAELERQGKRLMRSPVPSGASVAVDFARARYVDLIGLVETLTAQAGKKQSGGSEIFRCPWHDDWEPSLRVYPPGRGWHCFQCGRGGQDAASFCAEFFNCSQLEGLRWVEQLADMP